VNQEKESNRQQFKEMIKQGVSLIDFNAPWCAPCRAQKPILDQLAEKYKGRVTVAELDVDENRKVAFRMRAHFRCPSKTPCNPLHDTFYQGTGTCHNGRFKQVRKEVLNEYTILCGYRHCRLRYHEP